MIVIPDAPREGIPTSALTMVAQRYGDSGLMDLDLARIWGAIFVVGTKQGLSELRQAPETLARAAALTATLPSTLPKEVLHWAVWGQQRVSSRTLFYTATGVWPPGVSQDKGHPFDVSDVRRCLLLLEQVPSFRPALDTLAQKDRHWAALREKWDDIARSFEEERPDWRGPAKDTAPRTSAMIRDALAGAGTDDA